MIALVVTIGGAIPTGRVTSTVLLQVDPVTFGRNLYLILGALILLALAGFGILVIWIAVNCLLFFNARRQARIEHFRMSRRADGKRYPPAIEAVCELCKRGGRKIYFPDGGTAMCPSCYEAWWLVHDAAMAPVEDVESGDAHRTIKKVKTADRDRPFQATRESDLRAG